MNCFEKVTVNAQAINWLKEKYPELCIKAGLCERIGGRLYTKTFIDPPAAQPEQQAEPVAWLKEDWTGGHLNYESVYAGAFAAFPVYKHPPAAQPAQLDKPSASFNEWWDSDSDYDGSANPFRDGSAAYWAWAGWQAAQRPWVGLEAEDLAQIESDEFWQVGNHMAIAVAVEVKLKERNNG